MGYKHTVTTENAGKIAEWMTERGGIVVWEALDFSFRSWVGPYLDSTGQPASKPHYAAANQPSLHISDPAQVGVVSYREVKRIKIAVQQSRAVLGGPELTDHSSAKLKRALDKAGEGASYHFEDNEAVVCVPAQVTSLADWMKENQ